MMFFLHYMIIVGTRENEIGKIKNTLMKKEKEHIQAKLFRTGLWADVYR